MKNLLLAAVLLTSIQSQAQIKEAYQKVKQSVTGSAKISQPHYFPAQWEVLAQVGITAANKDFKPKSNNSFGSKSKQQTATTAITFGILDNVSLGMNLNYDFNNKYTYEGAFPSVNFKGIKDPVFNLTGRVGDFNSVKIDLKLAYQPKTDNFKAPDTTHDGNAVNGYRTTTVGAEFDFLVTSSSQVFLSADYNMLSERDLEDQTTGEITKGKALKSTMFKFGTLTEITGDSFFGITFSLFHQDGGITVQSNGTTTYEASEIDATVLTVVGKHEFTPNSALNIEFDHFLNGKLEDSNSEFKLEGQTLSVNYLIRF